MNYTHNCRKNGKNGNWVRGERYRESKLIGAIKIKNGGINLMVRARKDVNDWKERQKNTGEITSACTMRMMMMMMIFMHCERETRAAIMIIKEALLWMLRVAIAGYQIRSNGRWRREIKKIIPKVDEKSLKSSFLSLSHSLNPIKVIKNFFPSPLRLSSDTYQAQQSKKKYSARLARLCAVCRLNPLTFT